MWRSRYMLHAPCQGAVALLQPHDPQQDPVKGNGGGLQGGGSSNSTGYSKLLRKVLDMQNERRSPDNHTSMSLKQADERSWCTEHAMQACADKAFLGCHMRAGLLLCRRSPDQPTAGHWQRSALHAAAQQQRTRQVGQ
jgi:hypothetical protein